MSKPKLATSLLFCAGLLAACGGGGSDAGGAPVGPTIRDPELAALDRRARAASMTGITLPASGIGIYDGRAELHMDTTAGAGPRAHQRDHNLTADAAMTVRFGATPSIGGELRHFAMPDAPGYQVLGTMTLERANLMSYRGTGYVADLPLNGEVIYRQAGQADAIRTLDPGGEVNLELRGNAGQFVTGQIYEPATTWSEGTLRGSLSGQLAAER